MTLEELKAERANVQAAINNILEAGQEFQTRTSRVKFANLDKLYARLSQLDNAIAVAEGVTVNTVLLKYEGDY